jgi:uncharacterized OsmC-like protein
VLDVRIDRAEVELRATFPQEPKYDLGGDSVAMEKLTYVLDLASPDPAERVRAVVDRAEKTCHAANSLRVAVPVEPSVRLNGADL